MGNLTQTAPSGRLITRSPVREAVIEATVIRADGTVENLGVVSYYHKNPLKRLMWRLKQHRR